MLENVESIEVVFEPGEIVMTMCDRRSTVIETEEVLQ